MVRVVVSGDRAGEHLARIISDHIGGDCLHRQGFELYPEQAERVCKLVLEGVYDRAVLVCGTGIGVSIAANKIQGIRAALAHDVYCALKAATSNNANVLTLGARVVGPELAKLIVSTYLTGVFDPDGPSSDNVRALDRMDRK